MTEADAPEAVVGIVGLTHETVAKVLGAEAEAEETQRVYVAGVADEALKAIGVDVTSPGYHDARFAAAKAAEIVLSHAMSDERNQTIPTEGDQ